MDRTKDTQPNNGEPSVKRLLLVEDEALVASALVRSFARSGFAVQVAGSREEAESVSHDGAFDCGVFDIALGRDDGIALAKELAERGAVRTVVFFSATPADSARRRATKLGTFVSKSAGFDVLHEAVSRGTRDD